MAFDPSTASQSSDPPFVNPYAVPATQSSFNDFGATAPCEDSDIDSGADESSSSSSSSSSDSGDESYLDELENEQEEDDEYEPYKRNSNVSNQAKSKQQKQQKPTTPSKHNHNNSSSEKASNNEDNIISIHLTCKGRMATYPLSKMKQFASIIKIRIGCKYETIEKKINKEMRDFGMCDIQQHGQIVAAGLDLAPTKKTYIAVNKKVFNWNRVDLNAFDLKYEVWNGTGHCSCIQSCKLFVKSKDGGKSKRNESKSAQTLSDMSRAMFWQQALHQASGNSAGPPNLQALQQLIQLTGTAGNNNNNNSVCTTFLIFLYMMC